MMRKPNQQRVRVRRAQSIPLPLSADAGLGDTIDEYTRRVKTSKATAYRQMADGSLRYVMVRRQRRIPHSEYKRMGLVPTE
jgi:excisionase family DNA binding protein